MRMFAKSAVLPTVDTALAGRPTAIKTAERHFIFDRPLKGPFGETMQTAIFGMGCFWGAERMFWQLGEKKIWTTAVGYSGGYTPNPTYEEVCTGRTGHNEVVLVVFEPDVIDYEKLLRIFWEGHDPTQGMRQGNDMGTQYRSGIYITSEAQRVAAEESHSEYQRVLSANGYGPITTEILDAGPIYYAEDYHQQYLAKVPHGYCGLGGTGLTCPVTSN
ncbi:MAG: peptide-methionine (S)-S-oxide reductase MsrA [Hyphomicrobiaceae bacterium]